MAFKHDDIIDSRDLVARIAELTDELEDIDSDDYDTLLREQELLRDVVDQINDYSGDSAEDGLTLIADNYFETYAREFAEEIGAIEDDARWPAYCIDWARAARELQMDYTIIRIDGRTYWYR